MNANLMKKLFHEVNTIFVKLYQALEETSMLLEWLEVFESWWYFVSHGGAWQSHQWKVG